MSYHIQEYMMGMTVLWTTNESFSKTGIFFMNYLGWGRRIIWDGGKRGESNYLAVPALDRLE